MALPRWSRVRLVWALELSLGLELYACAVLALHARGLRATPLEASPALVLPALVIPPVFYVLVGLVSMRPLSILSVLGSAAAMCGLHALLVLATGALFMIPDLLDYGAAVAFALWGSPAVTLLQLTAAPLIFARLRPLLSPRAARAEARVALAQRRAETPPIAAPSRQLGVPATDAPAPIRPVIAPAALPSQREPVAAPPADARPSPAPGGIAPVSRPLPSFVKPPTPSKGPIVASPAPAARATNPPAPTRPAFVRPAAVTARPVVKPAAPTTPIVQAARQPDPTPEQPKSEATPPKRAIDWTEPMIRVPFVRIAEQLPVEMFTRGRDGLNDTLRPGVSLLVPRNLLLPHLGEALAPVRWEIVADQFPLDELALTHEEIADRLPDGSLLLPLDEVIPQIPPALLALSTPPVDVHAIEEFPAPFQPHAPTPSGAAEAKDAAPKADALAEAGGVAREIEAPADAGRVAVEPTLEHEAVPDMTPEPDPETVPDPDLATPASIVQARLTRDAAAPDNEPTTREQPVTRARGAAREELVAPDEAAAPVAAEPSDTHGDSTARNGRGEPARRIAALLGPLLNGLEIGQRDGAGATLVTVVAPTLSEDGVVRAAARIVPFLGDRRLPEPVTQATLSAAQATVVLTPFGSPVAGAILLTAVASRGSLAWLERLSRTAAREAQLGATNGRHSGHSSDPGSGIELRATSVPAAVREVAGSLTAFGPVAPTLLRDHAGALSACLFLPRSLDALPLARFARDLHLALDGAEIGAITSVILKLGTHRLVLRALSGASGHVTMLMGVGRVDRPGLARIELDRAASRLGALMGA
jgi:hypothetical protein